MEVDVELQSIPSTTPELRSYSADKSAILGPDGDTSFDKCLFLCEMWKL